MIFNHWYPTSICECEYDGSGGGPTELVYVSLSIHPFYAIRLSILHGPKPKLRVLSTKNLNRDNCTQIIHPFPIEALVGNLLLCISAIPNTPLVAVKRYLFQSCYSVDVDLAPFTIRSFRL
jgi:hypothetical protein